jgi:hypothetical protein
MESNKEELELLKLYICNELQLDQKEIIGNQMNFYYRNLADKIEHFIISAVNICKEKEERNFRYFNSVMHSLILDHKNDDEYYTTCILEDGKLNFKYIKNELIDYYDNSINEFCKNQPKDLIARINTLKPTFFIFLYKNQNYSIFEDLKLSRYLRRADRLEDKLINCMIQTSIINDSETVNLNTFNIIHDMLISNNIKEVDDAISLIEEKFKINFYWDKFKYSIDPSLDPYEYYKKSLRNYFNLTSKMPKSVFEFIIGKYKLADQVTNFIVHKLVNFYDGNLNKQKLVQGLELAKKENFKSLEECENYNW